MTYLLYMLQTGIEPPSQWTAKTRQELTPAFCAMKILYVLVYSHSRLIYSVEVLVYARF